MRSIATLSLDGRAGFDSSDTAAGSTLDLIKYFVNPGKREMKATLIALPDTTDSGTFDYKLQEAATTVDSDFSDISGATFTQVGRNADASTGTFQEIHFFTKQRYIRGVGTIAGGTWAVGAAVFAVKRDA